MPRSRYNSLPIPSVIILAYRKCKNQDSESISKLPLSSWVYEVACECESLCEHTTRDDTAQCRSQHLLVPLVSLLLPQQVRRFVTSFVRRQEASLSFLYQERPEHISLEPSSSAQVRRELRKFRYVKIYFQLKNVWCSPQVQSLHDGMKEEW